MSYFPRYAFRNRIKHFSKLLLLAALVIFPLASYAGTNQPPQAGTVTPSNGSSIINKANNITATYIDPDGSTNIAYAYLLVNSSLTSMNGLYACYNQNTNNIYMANNSGVMTGGYAPGSAYVIENTFVKIDCSKTTVSGSGTTLSVNWNVTFKSTFTGTKNSYICAVDKSSVSSGFVQKGTWMISASNTAPQVGSITPSSGTIRINTAANFTTTYTDANGWSDIAYEYLIINSSVSSANCMYAYYNQLTNQIYMMNDGATIRLGGYAPGSSYIIENSYAKIDCSKTTVSGSGTMLTINWNITFKPPFTGTKYAYMYVSDRSVSGSGTWAKNGTYTITANRPPQAETVTPSSGSSYAGTAVNFTTTYSDPDGYQNISYALFLVNSNNTSYQNCLYAEYYVYSNSLYLFNDATGAWIGPYKPGSSNIMETSSVRIDCSKTTVSTSGNTITVNWNVTFKPAFTGAKNSYLYVVDKAGSATGWAQKGTWTIVYPPDIVTTILPDAAVGQDYNEYLNAVGGTLPYIWSIASGSLPSGLVLDGSTGIISGKAKVMNTYNFTVKVTDKNLMTDTQALSINILPVPMSPDEQLLDDTEARAASYFYNEAFANGFVKDGDHQTFSSIAATGFGLASLCVMAERYGTTSGWTVTPEQARVRANQILDECIRIQGLQPSYYGGGNDYGIAGFLYHFVKEDGTLQSGSEVSTVDMALFLSGAITAGEYFGGDIKDKVARIYSNVNWNYYYNPSKKQFSHGSSYANAGPLAATWDRPGDEAMLVSLIAVGSDPDNQTFLETLYSWPRVENFYAGHKVVNSYFGSLFTYTFAHCYYDFEKLGFDNPDACVLPAKSVNWWTNSVSAAKANRQFCIDQSVNYSSYGPDSWGITACEYPTGGYEGRLGAAPVEEGPYHNGTIAPYGAISCLPLMRESADENLSDNPAFKALKFYHDTYYNNLWGPYGPRDSFNDKSEFNPNYYGINLGSIVLMIENYRSRLIWDNFMKNDMVKAATANVFSQNSFPPQKTLYVNVANASDPNQDGSQAHPYDRIQKAIDAGGSNTLVNIAPGEYRGLVRIEACINITLKGFINNRDNPLDSFSNTVINDPDGIILGSSLNATIDSLVVTGKNGDIFFGSGSVGVYCSKNSVIKNSIILNNVAAKGAGICSSNSINTLISDNLITDNYGHWGGGISILRNASTVYGENQYDAKIIRNEIVNNSAWYGPGGISVSGYHDTDEFKAKALIINNLVFGNAAGIYDGILVNEADVEIKNNIIANNEHGYGIQCYSSNILIVNNVMSNNGLSILANEYTDKSTVLASNNIISDGYVSSIGDSLCSLTYNDVYNSDGSNPYNGCVPGTGSISLPPLFVAYDTDNDPYNDDYHLQANSPCINAGDPDPVYNDKDGTRNDIGVYGGPGSSDPAPLFLNVPQDYPTIQAAIDAAAAGNVVKVAAGTYCENLTLNKSGIIIEGDNKATILDGSGNFYSYPHVCKNISGKATMITGLTIQNGGITCESTVNSLRIEQNNIAAGIDMKSGSSAVIAHNILASGSSNPNEACWVTAENNNNVRIEGNTFMAHFTMTNGKAVIKNNIISGLWDGAIRLYSNTVAEVSDNVFRWNTGWAYAAVTVDRSTAIFKNNLFTGNAIWSNVVAADMAATNNSSVTLYNNIFDRSSGGTSAYPSSKGTAVSCFYNTVMAAENNIFTRSSSGSTTIYSDGTGTQDFSYNDLWNNSTDNDSVGVTIGAGNIKADPLFIGGANSSDYDYHLQQGSPCIDTGADTYDRDIDGTRIDMGIYGGPYPMPDGTPGSSK